MVTTHALVGLLVALPLAVLAPDHATTVLAAGVVGGITPDLDVLATHRKTFHLPIYGTIAAGIALVLALAVPTAATFAVLAFLLAAALHNAGDIVSCGLGARPWHNRSERSVYDHYRGRWIPPRRWIRYDGAPEDLALAVGIAVPSLALLEWHWQLLATLLLGVSVVYTGARKRLEDIARWAVRFLPAWARQYVPERYVTR
ncbi:hypothetical protein [Natrialba magadii]|nr:hypothetical protein [Natrialba magadii]